MNAFEARQQTLWNNLPHIIQDSIMLNVTHGRYECLSVSRKEAEGRMKRADITAILEELGYTVSFSDDGKYYKISWKKYD